MRYIYLHGFASSCQSQKGQWLRDRFAETGIKLELIDFNQADFTHLTLTRQIQQVQQALLPHQPTTLIGSSFGGLTAAWVAETTPQVQQLVLLAPAFQFLAQWLPQFDPDQLQAWQAGKSLGVYHYGYGQVMSLDYAFVQDLAKYDETDLRRAVPTLVLHGQADETIAYSVSQDFVATRSWVTLCPLNSDHGLTDVMAEVWQPIQKFCRA
jgi:hypothetical protein